MLSDFGKIKILYTQINSKVREGISMSNEIKITIKYDEKLWDYLEGSTNNEMKIKTNQDDLDLFLMPKPAAGFQPIEYLITVINTVVTPLTISLLANWIFDLIKNHNAKEVRVNGKQVVAKDARGIMDKIKESLSLVKQGDIELKK